MKNSLKSIILGYMLNSIIFILVSILLIAYPTAITTFIPTFIGAIIVFKGITRIFEYLLNKDSYFYFTNGIFSGAVTILLGLTLIFVAPLFENLLRILLGVWIIFSAIQRVDFACNLFKVHVSSAIMVLLLAIAIFICGVYILITPGAFVASIGIVILIYAIFDLLESILYTINLKKL